MSEVNWKEGFERVMVVLTVLAIVVWSSLIIIATGALENWNAATFGLLAGSISVTVAIIWCIYGLIIYIANGFIGRRNVSGK